MHILKLLLAITNFSIKNSLVISSITKEITGSKSADRPKTRSGTGSRTKPVTRLVMKSKGMERFLTRPIMGSIGAKKLSISQIDICYSHQY